MDAERMRAALHEVWKYYDEAGRAGRTMCLPPIISPSSLPTCAGNMRRIVIPVTETVGKRCRTSSSRPTPAFINQLSLKAINWRLMQRSTSLHKEENHHAGCEHRNHG